MSKRSTIDAVKMEIVIRYSIECTHCGTAEEDYGCTEQEFAETIYKSGWRYAYSDYFGVEGLICDRCLAGDTDADDGIKADWKEC